MYVMFNIDLCFALVLSNGDLILNSDGLKFQSCGGGLGGR